VEQGFQITLSCRFLPARSGSRDEEGGNDHHEPA